MSVDPRPEIGGGAALHRAEAALHELVAGLRKRAKAPLVARIFRSAGGRCTPCATRARSDSGPCAATRYVNRSPSGRMIFTFLDLLNVVLLDKAPGSARGKARCSGP